MGSREAPIQLITLASVKDAIQAKWKYPQFLKEKCIKFHQLDSQIIKLNLSVWRQTLSGKLCRLCNSKAKMKHGNIEGVNFYVSDFILTLWDKFIYL